jgi:hypothetical protein
MADMVVSGSTGGGNASADDWRSEWSDWGYTAQESDWGYTGQNSRGSDPDVPVFSDGYYEDDAFRNQGTLSSSLLKVILIIGAIFGAFSAFILFLNGETTSVALVLFLTSLVVLAYNSMTYDGWVRWYERLSFWLGIGLFVMSIGFVTNFVAVLLVLVMCGFFPVSYLAYNRYEARTNYDQNSRPLVVDFTLMQSNTTAATNPALYKLQESFNKQELSYHPPHELWAYITLNIALTFFGVLLLLGVVPISANQIWDGEVLGALRYGFLGAYLFSLQLLYRRAMMRDVDVSVYMYTALNMLAGFIFNYVAFTALGSLVQSGEGDANTLGAGLLPILAFALGYFPYLAIRWFDGLAHRALSQNNNRLEQLSLDTIGGMSNFHQTRLRDMGIDNVQNLATVDIYDFMVRTKFKGQMVMDWVDQALLYVHLDATQIQTFRSNKIRTATDFMDYYDKYLANQNAEMNNASNILLGQVTREQLDLLHSALSKAPNIDKLKNYWRNKQKEGEIMTQYLQAQKQGDALKKEEQRKALEEQHRQQEHNPSRATSIG